ncbi:MAG: hypothetical protein ACTSQP_22910 [Promethearchaeota archaeon]
MNKSKSKQTGWKTCLKALKLEVMEFVEQDISIIYSLASLLPYLY